MKGGGDEAYGPGQEQTAGSCFKAVLLALPAEGDLTKSQQATLPRKSPALWPRAPP
jgi:hypothetical protein